MVMAHRTTGKPTASDVARLNRSLIAQAFFECVAPTLTTPAATEAELLMAELGTDDVYPGVTYQEVISFLKTLEELGFGIYKVGRHGRNTRFEWNEAPATIARYVSSFVQESGEPDRTSSPEGPRPARPVVEMHRHVFPLRRGLNIPFDLPLDLTPREAHDFVEFVKLAVSFHDRARYEVARAP